MVWEGFDVGLWTSLQDRDSAFVLATDFSHACSVVLRFSKTGRPKMPSLLLSVVLLICWKLRFFTFQRFLLLLFDIKCKSVVISKS